MKYDEAIKKLEDIVQSMETSEALSIDEYKKNAKEAKTLIEFCQRQLTEMEKDMKEALQ